MINERKVRKAVRAFLKNPGWKAEYEEAPSPLSKRYKALKFYYSEYDEKIDGNRRMEADLDAELDDLETRMSLEDWKYLYKHAGNNPFRVKCRDRIEKLERSGQTVTSVAHRCSYEVVPFQPDKSYYKIVWKKTKRGSSSKLSQVERQQHGKAGGYNAISDNGDEKHAVERDGGLEEKKSMAGVKKA